MTALALAWVGSLAFVAFVLWLRRPMPQPPAPAEPSDAAVRSVAARLDKLEPVVTALAIGAGLRSKPGKDAPA